MLLAATHHFTSAMDPHLWLLYTAAALGLSLSPGPNSLLALTHGALHGRRKTLHTLFGGSIGFLLIIALSLFGIGALLKASLVWLSILKWVGGAYLVWLGTQVWRAPPIAVERTAEVANVPGSLLFRQGFLATSRVPSPAIGRVNRIRPSYSPHHCRRRVDTHPNLGRRSLVLLN